MRAARGATGLSGLLLVDKPSGMTSHDVIAAVRRATGERRVGHAGTLDPMATGLLVVLVGPCTRLARYLTADHKVYEARIAFGEETDTDDAEGAVTRTAPVPVELAHAPFAVRALAETVGSRDQVPPAFSAVSVDGRRAHRLARDGVAVVLGARPVEVFAADLIAVYDTPAVAWDVRLHVSKGTYVRAIARDLGRDLGTAAHLAALRRLESGALTLADARPLADVEAAGRDGRVADLFTDPVAALGLPALAVVDAEDVALLAAGAALRPAAELAEGDRVAITVDGRLRAVYVRRGESLKAETVLGGAVSRIVTWSAGQAALGDAVVAIGVFDGVHIGHAALVRDTVALARERHVDSVVVTFDRDPDQVVDPEHAAPQLLELDTKLELLADIGPDVVLVVPFDAGVAALQPREFLDEVLLAALRPCAALVGHDFRFGAGASGDIGTLISYGEDHAFDVLAHPLVSFGGEPVTSTRVRSLVASGDVAGARALLGRPHRLRGEVVHGRGEGAALKARTANLLPTRYAARPPTGVYAGRVSIDGATHAAGVSVGAPPTFPGADDLVEAHVLGYEGDLYGRSLDIEFVARIRDLARFDTLEQLAEAIAADLARTRELVDGECA